MCSLVVGSLGPARHARYRNSQYPEI